ncbi:GNAT family N-acetyltransferase, partial [Streptomyces sp. SID8455]|nr:GNAT family N-acetyltransferase [Streptomyces sp. SID8455]
ARTDNGGSLGVSRRLGYEPDGLQVQVIRGAATTLQRLRVDRAGWEKHRGIDVTMEGLDACRADFGV